MFADTDLRELSELSSDDRAFLSVFLSGPSAAQDLGHRFKQVRRALKGTGGSRDERGYFDHNVQQVLEYLERNPLESGALVLYCCWALDFFKAIAVDAPLNDGVRVGRSPYLRPVAELMDEYDDVFIEAPET